MPSAFSAAASHANNANLNEATVGIEAAVAVDEQAAARRATKADAQEPVNNKAVVGSSKPEPTIADIVAKVAAKTGDAAAQKAAAGVGLRGPTAGDEMRDAAVHIAAAGDEMRNAALHMAAAALIVAKDTETAQSQTKA